MDITLQSNEPFSLNLLQTEKIHISKIISEKVIDLNVLIFVETELPDDKAISYYIHPVCEELNGVYKHVNNLCLNEVINHCKYTKITVISDNNLELKIQYEELADLPEIKKDELDNNPKVRIVFSGGNKNYTTWVLKLARKLSERNIGVIMDRHDTSKRRRNKSYEGTANIPSDVQLFIWTSNITKQFDADKYMSTGKIPNINEQFYKSINGFKSFMPIISETKSKSNILIFLNTPKTVLMIDDCSFKGTFETMIREIHNNDVNIVPPEDFHTDNYPTKERLIKISDSVSNSGLYKYASWRFVLEMDPDGDPVPEGFSKLVAECCLRDKNNKSIPRVLDSAKKVSGKTLTYTSSLKADHSPDHFSEEILQLENKKFVYEYAAYTNSDLLSLNLKSPLLSLVYLLAAIKKAQKFLLLESGINVNFEFRTNKEAVVNRTLIPFNHGSNVENYFPRESCFRSRQKMSRIDFINSYNLLDSIYGSFVSSNLKSREPFLSVHKQQFETIAGIHLN